MTKDTPDKLATFAVGFDDVKEEPKRIKDITIQWIACGRKIEDQSTINMPRMCSAEPGPLDTPGAGKDARPS